MKISIIERGFVLLSFLTLALTFPIDLIPKSYAGNEDDADKLHGGQPISDSKRPSGDFQFENYDRLIFLTQKDKGDKSSPSSGDNTAKSGQADESEKSLSDSAEGFKEYRLWMRDCATNSGDESAAPLGLFLDKLASELVKGFEAKLNGQEIDDSSFTSSLFSLRKFFNKKKTLFSEEQDDFSKTDEKVLNQIVSLVGSLIGKDFSEETAGEDSLSDELVERAVERLTAMKKADMNVCNLRNKTDRRKSEDSSLDDLDPNTDNEEKSDNDEESDKISVPEKRPEEKTPEDPFMEDLKTVLTGQAPQSQPQSLSLPMLPELGGKEEEKDEKKKEGLPFFQLPEPKESGKGASKGGNPGGGIPGMVPDPGEGKGDKGTPQQPKPEEQKPEEKKDKKDDEKKPEPPKKDEDKDKQPMQPPGANGPMMMPPMPSSSSTDPIVPSSNSKPFSADDISKPPRSYSGSGSSSSSSSSNGLLDMLRYLPLMPGMMNMGMPGVVNPAMMGMPVSNQQPVPPRR